MRVNKIKLSIITINYNNVLGLQKTIESVVSQTSQDFEYIIIDGGSTDGSIDVIKKYADRIKYWISEPDNGVYNAMNKGIRAANGEFCQFLNSGDFLVSPTVTSNMLLNIPECDIYYGNMLKKMDENRVLYNRKIPTISMLTFYKGTLNHPSTYIKRSLFDTFGLYDENLQIVSDWKFFMTVVGMHNVKVAYKDIDLTYFDMTGKSNTNNILQENERRKVLIETIPVNILADYDRYANYIISMKRLNRFKITKWLVFIVERILFKLEKIETSIKKTHIHYL